MHSESNRVYIVVDGFSSKLKILHDFLYGYGAHKLLPVRTGLETLKLLQEVQVDAIVCGLDPQDMTALQLLASVRSMDNPQIARTPFVYTVDKLVDRQTPTKLRWEQHELVRAVQDSGWAYVMPISCDFHAFQLVLEKLLSAQSASR